ncbi:HK97 family phage prohead protease [bacterium]|nr:HK97 family phage prohead protease [bacterium]
MPKPNEEKNQIERREIPLQLEIRQNDTGKRVVRGYAAKFNAWSETLGGWYREKIQPGAFANSLKANDVRSFFNHDPNFVIGRMSAGTLSLLEDVEGLFMEAELPDTQWARDLAVSIERGDITGQSFQFRVVAQAWKEPDKGGNQIAERTLIEVDLIEVGPVAVPAYPDTTVALRSLEQYKAERTAQESGGGPDGEQSKGRLSNVWRTKVRCHELNNF